jgi:adenylate kinase
MGKRLLLFGPPGVGKGTHSRRLAADVGVPHISTGDLFREAMQRGTDLGRRAAGFMNGGALVPDDVAVDALRERLARPDAAAGYLLDGFPRTVRQAQALESMMVTGVTASPTAAASAGPGIDYVLALEAPEDVLVKRLAGRATCLACGVSFNTVSRAPAVAGRCDACGGTLHQRPDDVEATVRRRLTEYAAKTSPVLAYLRQQGWAVRTIESVGNVDEIYGRIRQAVGN